MPISAMSKAIRVLLVEDNRGDARLIQEYLSEAGVAAFSLQTVDRLSAALTYLAENAIDAILLDLGLPDSHGIETLKRVRAQAPTVPVIVVTGFDDREMGVEALGNGAQDYLVKSRVDSYLLGRAIVRQLERARAASSQSPPEGQGKPEAEAG